MIEAQNKTEYDASRFMERLQAVEVELRDMAAEISLKDEAVSLERISTRASGKRPLTSSAIRSTPGPQAVNPDSEPHSGQTFGILVIANCSRIPAKIINANAKPSAVEIAYTTDSNKL